MKNFEVEECVTEDGAVLTIWTRDGLKFEDGSTVKEIVARRDFGPMVGERVMCDGRLIKVTKRRYDASYNLWLMDEDTRSWLPWRPQS